MKQDKSSKDRWNLLGFQTSHKLIPSHSNQSEISKDKMSGHLEKSFLQCVSQKILDSTFKFNNSFLPI